MLLRHIGQESFRLTNNSPQDAHVHKWWQGAKIQALCLSIQITHSAFKVQHSGRFTEKKSIIIIGVFIAILFINSLAEHSRPENLKKSRPKKIMESNKSISQKKNLNFFPEN